jgi:outer membrane protein assembly factor BamB
MICTPVPIRQMLFWLALAAGAMPAAGQWPGFRGPSRQGIAGGALPGGSLAWKVEIPGAGWSSPVVWGNTVFLTTATDQGASCRLLALDRDSGRVRWNVEILRQKTGRIEKKNSYASPTPVTDGESVYAVCGDGTFAAFDFSGARRWINPEYPHYSQHGLGSSPVLAGGLLIMARDGSSEGPEPKLGWQIPWDRSFVVALDARTGRERWRASRGQSRIAHVTPNVLDGVVISGAGDVVQGFELATGKLLWTGRNPGEGVVPSVVVGNGLVFTASGFGNPAIRAFRPGGAVAWEQAKGVPMISSLLFDGELLYSFTTNGIAWCFEAATGQPVWQQRLGGEFSASPVLAGGRILIANDQGTLFTLKAGRQFAIESERDLGEPMQASVAISDGRLYLRTAGHLLCYR